MESWLAVLHAVAVVFVFHFSGGSVAAVSSFVFAAEEVVVAVEDAVDVSTAIAVVVAVVVVVVLAVVF